MSMFTFEQKFNQLLIVQVCIFSKIIQWIHAILDFLKIRINDVSKRADLLIYSKHSSKQQALLHPIYKFSLICTKYVNFFFDCLVLLITSKDVTKQCLKSSLCSVRVSRQISNENKNTISSVTTSFISSLHFMYILSQYSIFVKKMLRYIFIVSSQSFPKEICL